MYFEDLAFFLANLHRRVKLLEKSLELKNSRPTTLDLGYQMHQIIWGMMYILQEFENTSAATQHLPCQRNECNYGRADAYRLGHGKECYS